MSSLFERPLLPLAAWVVLPVLFVVVFGDELSDIYRTVHGLGISFALIVAALVAVHWESVWPALRVGLRSVLRFHWGWTLVGLAVVLRYALLEFMPPAVPINLEEIQMGGMSMRILEGDSLPISHRFTAIMGAIGFAALDNSLNGLRVVFELAGALSILVMALTLRRLSAGWPATLLAVFTMASLGILVAGGGLAYENFSAIFFEVLLFYCVACAVTSRSNSTVWAGFAGIFGGVLMYEYDSYKLIVVIPAVLWFIQAICAGGVGTRRHALRAGSMYVLLLTIVGVAAFADILNSPATTSLLDGPRRHTIERGMFSADGIGYLRNSLELSWNYTLSVIGQDAQMAPQVFRIDKGAVVPLIPGVLFAISLLYALVGRVQIFPRIAAWTLLVMLMAAGFLANNFTLERIVPALPILVMLTGIAAASIMKRLQSGPEPQGTIRKSLAFYYATLTVIIIVINVVGIARTSSSEAVLREYQNNQYLSCLAIAEGHREFELDHVKVMDHGHCNKGDDLWLYPDMTAQIQRIDVLPGELDIERGTLMVLTDVHGLDDERLAEFTDLAWLVHSDHTLRSNYNLLGHVATMTFCHRCPKKDSPR